MLSRRIDPIVTARAELNDNFILAVRAGDVEEAQRMINRYGLPHSSVWDDGYVLLCEALHNNHTGVAKLLISHGAKLNSAENVLCLPPLHYAVINSDTHIVEALLEWGASVNAQSQVGETALFVATGLGNLNITKILLEHGASLNGKTESGCTALHSAAYYGHLEVVKFLLEKGAEVDPLNKKLETPFLMAVRNEHSGVCGVLCRFNANVNPLVNDGVTLLHSSAEDGSKTRVKMLLGFGSNVNVQMENGSTALHQAIRKSRRDVVQVLLDAGADVNIKDACGLTALHVAVGLKVQNQLDIVKMLLNNSAKINSENSIGKSPLHIAIEQQNSEIVDILLESGANVNAKDSSGDSPLHVAAETGQPQLVTRLLQCGADINLTNDKKETPFSIALTKISNNTDDTPSLTPNIHIENVKIFSRLILKMQFAELHVNIENAEAINHSAAKDYSVQCREEIQRMATEFIAGTNLTFFDVLVKDTRILASYLVNFEVVGDFSTKKSVEMFPLYAEEFNARFSDGLQGKSLLDKCQIVLLSLFPNLPKICLEVITKFLSIEDITLLVEGSERKKKTKKKRKIMKK